MTYCWRYFQSDASFHAFTTEGERSLCNAHEGNRHIEPMALLEELPHETICPFCKAVLKRLQALGAIRF
jgi:hypothetical protein